MNLEPIDTSTTAGKVRVMQLAAEGRRAVWRVKGDGQWRNSPVEWNWTDHQYAIIAEPVGPDEVWVTIPSGAKHYYAFADKKDSDALASGCNAIESVRYIRADLAGEVS